MLNVATSLIHAAITGFGLDPPKGSGGLAGEHKSDSHADFSGRRLGRLDLNPMALNGV